RGCNLPATRMMRLFLSLGRRSRASTAAVLVLAVIGVPTCGEQPHAQPAEPAYHLPFGSNPFLPSQATTDDQRFIPSSAFLPASYGAGCHKDIHRQWRESAHANSFREPFYLRNVELLNTTKGIESSRHCEGCHNPVALFSGALTAGSKLERLFDEEGITCTV